MLAELGQNREALALYDSLLTLTPQQASLWFNRAELKTFTPGDPDIEAMAAVLNSSTTQALKDRQMMHFALGKAYLDTKQNDLAFEHLHLGNQLVRQTVHFDPDATQSWMGQFPQIFTSDSVNRTINGQQQSERPVFIVGMMRSGTTLVEQILAAHPQIIGLGERPDIQRLTDLIRVYPADMPSLSDQDLSAFGARYLEQTQPLLSGKQGPIRYTADKMPANFLHIGLIRQILPNARIIHCRRNAVDTCLSCYIKLFSSPQPFAYRLEDLGRFYLSYATLMEHWRSILPSDLFIEIDYETVVSDLEGQARRLIDFLDLPWDESCLSFHKNKGAVRTASAAQVRQPIYSTSAGRWRQYEAYLEPLLKILNLEQDSIR